MKSEQASAPGAALLWATPRGPRALRVAALSLIVAVVATSCAFALGARERGEPAAEGPLRGDVVAVRTVSGGEVELTVRQSDGSTVYIVVPRRLASSIRPQEGDRIIAEEQEMARDGERLRVQRLQIERGDSTP
ncbi:MAG: hypothetical protein ACLFUM_06790 [Spirochaetaceae bacterium]